MALFGLICMCVFRIIWLVCCKSIFVFASLQQEEDMGDLQKRIAQLENDYDTCQTQLEEANQKLEATEKQLANVSNLN